MKIKKINHLPELGLGTSNELAIDGSFLYPSRKISFDFSFPIDFITYFLKK